MRPLAVAIWLCSGGAVFVRPMPLTKTEPAVALARHRPQKLLEPVDSPKNGSNCQAGVGNNGSCQEDFLGIGEKEGSGTPTHYYLGFCRLDADA
jgi:hypothetical protein